ncbi:MAG: hypothetical protein V3T31_07125 [candidate division Zixibacteria bacterium]
MKRIFLSILLLSMTMGCGLPKSGDEYAFPAREGWEVAWVDPQVMISSDLITLIRAKRIDWMPASNATPSGHEQPGIMMVLPDSACNVTVSLLDHNDKVVMPLLIQTLEPGYYKLTASATGLFRSGLPAGKYRLVADYCNRQFTAELTLP